MKKTISLILSIFAVLMSAHISIHASSSEVIITANQAEWKDGAGSTLSPISMNATEWGDGTRGGYSVELSDYSGAAVTYSELPAGLYELHYYLPRNNNSESGYGTGRSARILDNDIQVKDNNGTYDIISIKDHIYDSGYKNLGVFEFDGIDDYVKVTVNEDNKVVRGQWTPFLLSNHIKLVPVSENNAELLNAVNSADTAGALETAVSDYGQSFVDYDALYNMNAVYEKIILNKPQDGFTSSYQFKRVFDECVISSLTKVEIPASSFVWQGGGQTGVDNNGYRINWPPISISHHPDTYRAIVTFRFLNVEGIKKLDLKLNYDTTDQRTQNSAVIKKYSGDIYENPNSNKTQDKTMNSVNFTDMSENKKLMLSNKDITSDELILAIKENGYLSLYMEGDTIVYNDPNCGYLYLSLDSTLTAYYDLSYLGGLAELKYYDSTGTEIDADNVSIENEYITVKNVNGYNFADFEFLNTIKVKANDDELAESDYTVEKTDDATLKIVIKDGMKYDTKYTVSSDKYIEFEGDDFSYEFKAEFTTEDYPVEFSGINVKTLDGMNGKSVNIEAEIKNNSMPAFDAYLIINLYEQTPNGSKMIDSLLVSGKVEKNSPLTLSDSFTLPEGEADYFITSHIWDGFTTMNYVKMFNKESYQRID